MIAILSAGVVLRRRLGPTIGFTSFQVGGAWLARRP
jgi:hypothetical protein